MDEAGIAMPGPSPGAASSTSSVTRFASRPMSAMRASAEYPAIAMAARLTNSNRGVSPSRTRNSMSGDRSSRVLNPSSGSVGS